MIKNIFICIEFFKVMIQTLSTYSTHKNKQESVSIHEFRKSVSEV